MTSSRKPKPIRATALSVKTKLPAPLPPAVKPLPERSAVMRAVKSTDTKPELAVRKLAHAISPGYRLNRNDLPGKPDLAWIGAKKAVFVHGCFWHGHDCARGARVPRSNRDYWLAKVARNVERDEANEQALLALGWSVLTLWECDLKQPDAIVARLRAFLDGSA